MAKKIAVINKLRAKIVGQGVVDLEAMAKRVSKNTTFNAEEVNSMLRLFVQEAIAALQAGETVKIDDLLNLSANMKVGGKVSLGTRPDRGAIAGLSNPELWPASEVTNHANMTKTTDELLAQWDVEHPNDLVED